jgi:hypothetical protein
MTQLLEDLAKQLGHFINPILQFLLVLLQLLELHLQPRPQPILRQLDSLTNQLPLPIVNTKLLSVLWAQ